MPLCHHRALCDIPQADVSLTSKFHRILNVVVSNLGDSPASEFYVPTFRNNVSSIFMGGVKFRRRGGGHPKERLQQDISFPKTTQCVSVGRITHFPGSYFSLKHSNNRGT